MREPLSRSTRLSDHGGLYSGCCFVVASGPSLGRIPQDLLAHLNGEWTFVISSVIHWEGLPFEPSFYMSQEVVHWAYFNNLLNNMGARCLRFHADRFMTEVRDPWVLVPIARRKSMEDGYFAGLWGELNEVVGVCGSLSLMVAQLACFMGFRQVYLLGCDATDTGYVWDLEYARDPKETARFIHCASIARRLMAFEGRELIDLTEGGNLVIPRASLKEVLGATARA